MNAQQPYNTSVNDDQIFTAPDSSDNPHTTAEAAHLKASPGHVAQGIPNIDSLPNFSGHYMVDGVDQNGNSNKKWYYNMVGSLPQQGGTTTLNAPIVPVIVDLRNGDGTPRFVNGHPLVSDPTQQFVTTSGGATENLVQATLKSPVFQNYSYTSSTVPTQFTDAVQRAEYWNRAKADWHTLLNPSVKTPRRMILKKGQYRFALNPDGTCCWYILADYGSFGNAFFPSTPTDTTTPIGAAENAGDITPQDFSIFLFPNTYLSGSFGCCVLGYHSYDSEPGTPANGNREKRYVVSYASWITPGLFGAAFQDVTAVSHEVAEAFNDPFVASDGLHNITPFWHAPNGNCQDNLETGDVVEGLPNATFPITMNGYTYNPQNEALLQYFEFAQPSDAVNGSYSYPDGTVLTSPSAPQNYACK